MLRLHSYIDGLLRPWKHVDLDGLEPIPALALGGLDGEHHNDGISFTLKPVQPDAATGANAAPFSIKRPLPEQVWHDRHAVEPCCVLGGDALLEIGLHGLEMIPPCDVQGLGLLGADVLLGALDAGVAQKQLCGAQVACLLVDMAGEGPSQRVQPVEAGIKARLLEPGLEQAPELALAEVGM